MWMTHTPHGNVVADPMQVGEPMNQHVSYSGSAVSMYAHMGTHIDALNHFGLNGKIWNGFDAQRHLGDRGWHKAGVENYPPIIARGVLLDVARYKGVEVLPESYGISVEDLRQTAKAQGIRFESGDVVMVRTGRMQWFKEPERYMHNTPGLTRESADFLAEQGAVVIGVDNISTDVWPSKDAPA